MMICWGKTMTEEQKTEFEQRRLAVMRAHVRNDPKHRKFRRKRRLAMARSVLGSIVALGVALVLIKSFILALEGQGAYARMVAPMLERQAEGSILARALGPDPASSQIAAMVRPLLRDRASTQSAERAPAPLGVSQTDIAPEPEALQ